VTVPTNDHWTLDLEKLGMDVAGDKLAQLVLRCRPPYAICVQGKWGAGKTSLMRYAMARLGGKPLGTTLRTAEKPTIELAESLRRSWDERAKGAGAACSARTSRPTKPTGAGATSTGARCRRSAW